MNVLIKPLYICKTKSKPLFLHLTWLQPMEQHIPFNLSSSLYAIRRFIHAFPFFSTDLLILLHSYLRVCLCLHMQQSMVIAFIFNRAIRLKSAATSFHFRPSFSSLHLSLCVFMVVFFAAFSFTSNEESTNCNSSFHISPILLISLKFTEAEPRCSVSRSFKTDQQLVIYTISFVYNRAFIASYFHFCECYLVLTYFWPTGTHA